jgi:hypothetical protein
MKVRATYLTMESTDPVVDFKLSGFGIDFVGRKPFGNHFAMDVNIGVTYLDGDMAGSSLYGATIPLGFNLEVQPFKNDVVNVIIFGGPSFSISSMTLDMPSDTMYIDSYVFGFTGGVQLGLTLGPVGIDAFGMTTTQSGTQEMYSTSADTSTDIPSYTTSTFGLDLAYLPWGLTLSSLLQEAGKSDSNGTKTRMYQLAWSHKF